MSGVTGSERIKSRKSYNKILESYKGILKDFPGFVSVSPSGSFNSNLKKKTFGDMDLIFEIRGGVYNYDKKLTKLKLIEYLKSYSDKIIVPFTSEKYKGKRHYNSGEIVTVNYKIPSSTIAPCQIDNIIAMTEDEANFKTKFLDIPAEKQGLILGLIKTFTVEKELSKVFDVESNSDIFNLKENEEFEYSLSSSELQLRKITYKSGTFEQENREIVWRSNSWFYVLELLRILGYNIDCSFEELLNKAKKQIKYERSFKRIKGIFNSMISIKSGEVGTEKAQSKQEAIDKINSAFSKLKLDVNNFNKNNSIKKEQERLLKILKEGSVSVDDLVKYQEYRLISIDEKFLYYR